VFKRVWQSRLPIRQLYGPNLAVELMRGRSEEVARKVVEDVMPRRLQHEIGRAIKKLGVSSEEEGSERNNRWER
jgi:hypothetical protein